MKFITYPANSRSTGGGMNLVNITKQQMSHKAVKNTTDNVNNIDYLTNVSGYYYGNRGCGYFSLFKYII